MLESLREHFPADRLLLSQAARTAFETDGLFAIAARPCAVVMPETEAEVIAAIRWCNQHHVPFTPRGSGTSLSGAAVPVPDGLVIALHRMNKILRVDPLSRVAVVQPGAVNLAVSRAAAAFGLHYAPDPSSAPVCTIGGNFAFNAGGAHCLKYGMTSNHVLATRFVLGDGTLVQTGTGSLESVGPDLTGLLCGSEGLMGIATELTLRLSPKPESFHTVLAGYSTLEQAGDAVSTIIASGLLPGAMEIMDRVSMRAAREAVGAKYPDDVEAVLLVELDGSIEQVDEERPRLDALIAASHATSITVAEDNDHRLKLWKGRKSVFSAVGRLSPDFIVQDGVVPRSRLGEALRRIEQISRQSGVPVANVFHAGDGNLHPLIMFDGRIEGALSRAEAVAAQIIRLCIELGGSITGEHGVGLEKREFLGGMFDPVSIEQMRRICHSVDPSELANPGKVFPTGEAQPIGLYGAHPLEKAGIIERL
jgi:glycolate oxidase